MAKAFDVLPTDDTIKNQNIAGDPEKSIWVSANAGSGKTHILTLRVLRLLLNGVAPENILCLTYTKAAAAEMKNRVARDLGIWSVMEDVELSNVLYKMSNTLPSPEILLRARTLFALALETPGGLKISTIHAFCEAALHRFPLEADVPVDFSVIEEAERAKLIQQAQDRVLANGLKGNDATSVAVGHLFSLMSDSVIADAVKSALGQGRQLRAALADIQQTKTNLRVILKATQFPTSNAIVRDGLAACRFDASACERVFALTPPNPAQNRFEDRLAKIDWDNFQLEELFQVFLTKAGTKPKKGFPKKSIKDEDPGLADLILDQAEDLEKVFADIKKANLIQRSESLLDVMQAIHGQYESAKEHKGQLDFDDLIIRFEQLLSSKTSSDWVRYKMDAGMTHILVDESQDTNPDQWRVVQLLVEDFFSGDSAVEVSRTVFGVGDEKQSIFGFQGADPALFAQTGGALKLKAVNSGKAWENVRFPASFRTLENILNAVDVVCQRADIRAALLSIDAPVVHESARTDKGGTVTLWPPIQIEKSENTSEEWLNTPAPSNKGAPRLTAERIVTQIAHWIKTKRAIGGREQAVGADDILILVQTRGAVFHEIIRALKIQNIPTPGADRLSVTKHIVVRDLLTLGDVLLDPNDDLSLATLLRSPLFDLTIEQLELVCVGRDKGVTVSHALEDHAPLHPWAKLAHNLIADLAKNLDQSRPYEFFAELLFSKGGLKKFHARLGEEIDEILDAFLDLALEHEQSPQPSLQGFLASLRAKDIEIKRELSEGGMGVRVMTVHGAKGLEAPIVILADADKKPRLKGSVIVEGGSTPLFVHGSKDEHTPETLEALRAPKEQKENQEYWRKLYVAMTRAEDELYVTGVKPISDTDKVIELQPSWYGAIQAALKGQLIETEIVGETEHGYQYPAKFTSAQMVSPGDKAGPNAQINFSVDPIKLKPEIETIRPSTAFDDATALNRDFQDGDASADAELARKRGTALHTLLQFLVPIALENRAEIARKALPHILSNDEDAHDALIEKALSILSGSDAARLFGPNTRAELPVFVFGEKNKRPIQIIGRIDRIIAEENTIMLVDFKSNASPPNSANELSGAYKTQMGLYLRCGNKLFANHKITTAIYWTSNETLMGLSNDALLGATQQFNIT